MRQFIGGLLVGMLLLAAAAAWVWYERPELLPEELRRKNPQSSSYAPPVYRWKDAQGRTQISDSPPKDRPYETVIIDPATNIVPDTLPREREVRKREP